MSNENEKAVVVAAHNAIFFGYLITQDYRTVTLRNARNAYYAQCTDGFGELAASGPKLGSKIGARVPVKTVFECVQIDECSAEAIIAWEERGWGV